MSFAAQEQVLFDLLFDAARREAFLSDPAQALSGYALTPDEAADFRHIRPDALAFDARVRLGLMLSQLCRSFPLGFSLVSSLSGGLEFLKTLIDGEWIRLPPAERATAFGLRLRERLPPDLFQHAREHAQFTAVLDAELGITWTAAQLRAALQDGYREPPALPDPSGLLPLRLPAFSTTATLPRPYAELKAALCPITGAELWRHLNRTPTAESERQRLLTPDHPRLLVIRAVVTRRSACDTEIDHRTAELPEGFAALFELVDGNRSLTELLEGLAAAGAAAPVLDSIEAGFRQLLQAGLLETVPPAWT